MVVWVSSNHFMVPLLLLVFTCDNLAKAIKEAQNLQISENAMTPMQLNVL